MYLKYAQGSDHCKKEQWITNKQVLGIISLTVLALAYGQLLIYLQSI